MSHPVQDLTTNLASGNVPEIPESCEMNRSLLVALTGAALIQAAGAANADGAISELRIGALAHDTGVFGHRKESGVDVNAELYFQDLRWLGGSWETRPSIGMSINSEGNTSQMYAGLNIGRSILGPLFMEFGAGAAVHNGETETTSPDRKELGSQLLFHLSGSLGIRISDSVTLSAYLEHISNAGLADRNEGLNNAGARIGFRF